MRPAMMLLLRALVVLGAVLAVLSCTPLAPVGPVFNAEALAAATAGENCSAMPLAYSSSLVPAAFVKIAYPGGGSCL